MTKQLILCVALAMGLGGCAVMDVSTLPQRFGLPPSGFMSVALFQSSGPSPAALVGFAHGCSEAVCAEAEGFCSARGYRSATDGYRRCIVSVEQNLRRNAR